MLKELTIFYKGGVMMSSAPCIDWLAWKLWRSCNVIKAHLVQPAFVNFFWSAHPYSINFAFGLHIWNNALLLIFYHSICLLVYKYAWVIATYVLSFSLRGASGCQLLGSRSSIPSPNVVLQCWSNSTSGIECLDAPEVCFVKSPNDLPDLMK